MKIYDIPFIGDVAKLFKCDCVFKDLQGVAKKLKPISETENVRSFVSGTKDNTYSTCPREYVVKFNKVYDKYKMTYEKERWDCDNMAVDYMALFYRMVNMIDGQTRQLALGLCSGYFDWTGAVYHEINFFIDCGVMYFVEPQSGKIYDKSHVTKITSYYI